MDNVDVSLLTLLVCLLIYLVKWCRKQKGSTNEDQTKTRKLRTSIDQKDPSNEDASQVKHRRRPKILSAQDAENADPSEERFTWIGGINYPKLNLARSAKPEEVSQIYAQEPIQAVSVPEVYERQLAYPVVWLPPPPPDPPNPP